MIKICFITPSFPYMSCGVGDYTFELIKSFKGIDFKVGVLTLAHEKIKKFMQDRLFENCILFPVVKRWNFGNLFVVLSKIRNFRPEIIHIQYHQGSTNDGFILKGLMMVFLPFFLKLLKVKSFIVTTLHSRLDGPYLFPRAWILRRWAIAPLLLFSNKIIVTNRFDEREVYRHYPFLKNKVNYIAGGTGHYLADESLKEDAFKVKFHLKNSQEEIIISNFGFMVPYKGIEELLQAMHMLRKKGYPLRLLAIGGFDTEFNLAGSYFEKLQKIAEELNLKPYVKWTGFCRPKEASLHLLASDICVMPFKDGASEWRSSFLDALSHGLPIITTFTERTPSELKDKVNCILVPPEDSNYLAKAIEELILSPQLRMSLGRAARELYKNEYDWPAIARKTTELYGSGLKEKSIFN